MEIILSELFCHMREHVIIKDTIDCVIKVAGEDKIGEICKGYGNANITCENIDWKLDKTSSMYFGRRGGIFTIPSASDVGNIIKEGKDVFVVSENMSEGGYINAILHVSVKSSCHYDDLRFHVHVPKGIVAQIENAIALNKIVYPLEYISVSELSGGGMVFPMLSNVYGKMADEGYEYALVEIYTVMKYLTDAGDLVVLNAENTRSVAINEKIGGKNIGYLDLREYAIKGKKIVVRPEIYVIRLSEAIEKIKIMSLMG